MDDVIDYYDGSYYEGSLGTKKRKLSSEKKKRIIKNVEGSTAKSAGASSSLTVLNTGKHGLSIAEYGLSNLSHAWISRTSYMPQMIWYDFDKKFVLSEVMFNTFKSEFATKFQIVGSNDITCGVSSAWSILYEDLSGDVGVSNIQTKRCIIDDKINVPFKCFGIRVLSAKDSLTGKESCVKINNIQFWKKVFEEE